MPAFPSVTPTPVHMSSRQQLKDYCLRRLGAPVIEINVDDDQVEDRVQDAIEFFQEYHFDGTERMYMKSLIDGSTLTFTTQSSNSWIVGEQIVGQTSGATAKAYRTFATPLGGYPPNTNPQPLDEYTIMLKQTQKTFVDGEVVMGLDSGTTSVVAVDGFYLGAWDKQYISVGESVLGVTRIFILGPGTAGLNTRNIFDVVYQFRLNDMYDLMSTDLIYYAQVKQHLSLLDMMLPGERSIRFSRKQDQLHIDMNWTEQLVPGTHIIAECYRLLDPEEYPKIYNDLFLKRYTTALIKRQWGNNLKKFDGVKLLGGVTLNGDKIFQEATEEITKIEEEMQSRYEMPPFFEIG